MTQRLGYSSSQDSLSPNDEEVRIESSGDQTESQRFKFGSEYRSVPRDVESVAAPAKNRTARKYENRMNPFVRYRIRTMRPTTFVSWLSSTKK